MVVVVAGLLAQRIEAMGPVKVCATYQLRIVDADTGSQCPRHDG